MEGLGQATTLQKRLAPQAPSFVWWKKTRGLAVRGSSAPTPATLPFLPEPSLQAHSLIVHSHGVLTLATMAVKAKRPLLSPKGTS